MERWTRSTAALVALLLALGAQGAASRAAALPEGGTEAAVSAFDRALASWAREAAPEGSAVRSMSRIVTELGGPIGIFAAVAALAHGKEGAGEQALAAAAYTGAIAYGIKTLAGRARPGEKDAGFFGPTVAPGRDSFPSGHTAAAFAVAAVAGSHFPEWREEAFAAALLVGVSRILLDRHWATDVLAGAALGLFVGDRVANGAWGVVWEW